MALAFFAIAATMTPIGIGATEDALTKVAGGVLWTSALLACLLSLDRLFQADFEDGSLDLIMLSPSPLESPSPADVLSAAWVSLTCVSPTRVSAAPAVPAAVSLPHPEAADHFARTDSCLWDEWRLLLVAPAPSCCDFASTSYP